VVFRDLNPSHEVAFGVDDDLFDSRHAGGVVVGATMFLGSCTSRRVAYAYARTCSVQVVGNAWLVKEWAVMGTFLSRSHDRSADDGDRHEQILARLTEVMLMLVQ
jgi:hypothetical protein